MTGFPWLVDREPNLAVFWSHRRLERRHSISLTPRSAICLCLTIKNYAALQVCTFWGLFPLYLDKFILYFHFLQTKDYRAQMSFPMTEMEDTWCKKQALSAQSLGNINSDLD